MYFLLTVGAKFSCTDRLLAGLRAAACEQEFWFGISRFMREIPDQRICLAGPQHDVTITLTFLETRGQHHNRETKNFFFCSLRLVNSGIREIRNQNTYYLTHLVYSTSEKRRGVFAVHF